jgi:hypothetical protein
MIVSIGGRSFRESSDEHLFSYLNTVGASFSRSHSSATSVRPPTVYHTAQLMRHLVCSHFLSKLPLLTSLESMLHQDFESFRVFYDLCQNLYVTTQKHCPRRSF